MSKSATSPLPGIPGNSSYPEAGSLRTQPGGRAYYDDDVPDLQTDDLPPLYSDIENDAGADTPLLPHGIPSHGPEAPSPSHIPPYRTVDASGTETVISRCLDEEPQLLEEYIRQSAMRAPRPSIRILGTHSETVTEDGKSETKTITDFDLTIDLLPYLFSNAGRGPSWSRLRTVENYEKARRGTVLKTTAPRARRDIELGTPAPTLTEWCHRYAASPALLKTFTLQRRMVGFDEELMREKLKELVRRTNYRGRVTISFPVRDEYVIVMSDCEINRWRSTAWVFWLCVFTFMWIFTWPYLFFSTKRFEVAIAEWPFSVQEADGSKRYVSMSEEHLFNLWGRAIRRAVLDRRRCTLSQQDLIAAETNPNEAFRDLLEGAPRLLRDTVNAITAVDTSVGWGGGTR